MVFADGDAGRHPWWFSPRGCFLNHSLTAKKKTWTQLTFMRFNGSSSSTRARLQLWVRAVKRSLLFNYLQAWALHHATSTSYTMQCCAAYNTAFCAFARSVSVEFSPLGGSIEAFLVFYHISSDPVLRSSRIPRASRCALAISSYLIRSHLLLPSAYHRALKSITVVITV